VATGKNKSLIVYMNLVSWRLHNLGISNHASFRGCYAQYKNKTGQEVKQVLSVSTGNTNGGKHLRKRLAKSDMICHMDARRELLRPPHVRFQ
jgi:hypothetical protein